MKPKIIMCSLGQKFDTDEIRDQYYHGITSYLQEQGLDVEVVNGREGDEELTISQLQGADGVIFSSNGPVTNYVLDSLPQLKLVMRYGVGLNSVDLDACNKHGVIVCNTPGYCNEELSVHAIAMGLAVLRNLKHYDVNIRKGVWLKGNGVLPTRPSNMTVGVYGFGASGRLTSKIMSSGFESKVIACDPYANLDEAEKLGVEVVDFERLLLESDMIFVHAPLTEETYHVFDREAFRKMKNTAIIVNVSRGPIIDNDALNWALETGEIAKAALDVFEQEPVKTDNPLLGHDHFIGTPHNAYYSKEALEDIDTLIGHIVTDAFKNKKLYRKHLCNPAVMDRLEGYILVDEEIPLH